MEFREHEKEYAGKGTTALGTIGTILGSIGTAGTTGILGNLFGNTQPACSENMPVNRYELSLTQENSALKQQIALRDSQVYVDQKISETVAFYNGELNALRQAIAAQAVQNQKTEDAFALVGEKLGCLKNEFTAALCRESDERRCGDTTMWNYANAAFATKLVAGATPDTTSITPQQTYNPFPCACK